MALSIGMISLGCTKNRVDSEQALGALKEQGYTLVSDPAQADILLVNTCGFIESAKEESIDTILEMAQYKKTGKCRLLVVTGCLAQRYHQALLDEMPEIDVLLGVNNYNSLAAAIQEALQGRRMACCDPQLDFWEHGRVLTTPGYTAYTRIGDGCNNRCAYCAIPLIRGRYRSRPMDSILGEVAQLAAQGVREHILVAQDTTRYGTDWQAHSQLPQLMERAALIPGVDWLRVLYCYPDETGPELLETMARHSNICKYLDLPIQHISPRLLKAMNRRGSPAQIKATLKMAREMGFALRTSIIVGFPGETEDDFKALMDFIEDQRFDRLGAFTYSAEEDTPAAAMPNQIPQELKAERLDRLMKRQAEISLAQNRKRVGETCRVLVTGREGDHYIGRSQWEAPEIDGQIHFTSQQPHEVGQFAQVAIRSAQTYDFTGVAL